MNTKPETTTNAPIQSDNPLDEAVADADARTLDRVLRYVPGTLTDDEWEGVVKALRNDRARFIYADRQRQERKDGPS